MSSLITSKTNAERAREYRARIRASKPPKKAPKTGLERNREWRERKKQLQMECKEEDGLHDPPELYAFKQEMVCEDEPRGDEGSCHAEKFSLDGPPPVVDSVGGLKEVPSSGLITAVKQEHTMECKEEDGLHDPPELYAFKQEMVCEDEPRGDEGSCHAEKFSLDGPTPAVDSVGGLKEVPSSGLIAAVKQEHTPCTNSARVEHLENDPLEGCGDEWYDNNTSSQPHPAEMCKTNDKIARSHSSEDRNRVKVPGSGYGVTRRKLCPILPLPDFLKDVQVCNTRLLHPPVEESSVEETARSEIYLNDQTFPSSTASLGVGKNGFLRRGKKRPAADDIDREILKQLKRQPSYDEEELFCLSLVGSLKRLRPQDLIKVKSQFYQVLADEEYVD